MRKICYTLMLITIGCAIALVARDSYTPVDSAITNIGLACTALVVLILVIHPVRLRSKK
jgi:hypothetical protein